MASARWRDTREGVRDLSLRSRLRRNPHLDTFHVDLDDCGPMVLDALIWIKNKMDSTLDVPPLLPRRRLRLLRHEHRRHQLVGLHAAHLGHGTRRPRFIRSPICRIIKDLVPDLTHVFAQYAVIEPWLRSKTPEPEKERLQSRGGAQPARRLLRVHPVLLLHFRMPEPLVERRSLSRPCSASSGVALADRQPRRGDRRTARQSRRPLSSLSLPHHPQLHPHLPEGLESGQGDRGSQEDDRRARKLTREREIDEPQLGAGGPGRSRPIFRSIGRSSPRSYRSPIVSPAWF